MRTVAPVKHLKRYRDRHGKLRLYHRPSGTPIASVYGTPEFFQELERLNAKTARQAAKPKGTLLMVWEAYKKPAFLTLAPETQKGYEKYFKLLAPFHNTPVREITSATVSEIRDHLFVTKGRRTANYVMAVLSVVFAFAVEKRYAHTNPVKEVKRVRKPKKAPRANRPWTAGECRAVIDRAPPHLRLPLAMCMFTGMRKRDALTLTAAAIDKAGRLTFETSKTDEMVSVMPHQLLKEALARRPHPNAKTLAVTMEGQTWTSSGFDTVWSRFKADLEKEGLVEKGLTIHGLRHTVGGLLADAGCDPDTIRRVLGQKTLHMALLYSERAKRARDTHAAMADFDPFRLDNFGEIEMPSIDG